ncbi:hypothetical protein KQI22_00550 [Kineothrix sp. MSJ-39]|uniref:hypothetical protein n=1 Tax=Kineothrix sp. MSJ-39 TaxID=2841533 RepID=UPI001C1119E6|nr:hypothetical protein [Kineothrix sp. MSJ-39]MBU5428552.1 hypothetical protein [Kineothrix sp. MSJ-39]
MKFHSSNHKLNPAKRMAVFGVLIGIILLCILCTYLVKRFYETPDLGQAVSDEKNQNAAYAPYYSEDMLLSLDGKSTEYCGFFVDQGEPYFMVKSKEIGYQLIHGKKGEENIRSRFHDSFVSWREAMSKSVEEQSLTYAVIYTPDTLYLVGKRPSQAVAKLYCLYPEEKTFKQLMCPPQFRNRSFLDIYGVEDNIIFARVSNAIYSYSYRQPDADMEWESEEDHSYVYLKNDTVDQITWECNVYQYNNICHFLAGRDYFYYLSKGKIYQIDRQDDYSHMNFIPNERITDVTSPACLDQQDRIYIADSCGIMSYSPTGELWELLVSNTGNTGFNGENQTLLDLSVTEEHDFYLVVQDNQNRQVKLYAYTHD